ncbi:MAG: hypothetical protein ACKOAH_10175, partial [Pirellula sp.]
VIDSAIAQFDSSLIAKDAELGTVDTQMKQMQATLAEMQKKSDESKSQLVGMTSKVQASQVAIDAHRVSMQTVETQMAKLAEECSLLKAEHVGDLLSEDREGVIVACMLRDSDIAHVVVDLAGFIAIPKLDIVEPLGGITAVGSVVLGVFFL